MPKARTVFLNALVIASCAHFIARAANAVVEHRFAGVPLVYESAAPVRHERAVAAVTSIADMMGLPDAVNESEAATSACTLPHTVIGTLVESSTPEWSLAILADPRTHEPRVFTLTNSQIDNDTTLVDIHYRELVIRRSGHIEICAIDHKPTTMPVAAVGTAVKRTGAFTFEVHASLRDSLLEAPNPILQDARAIAAYDAGKPIGLRLRSIRPGSFYEQIGLQNGDVITAINDMSFETLDRGLAAYSQLRSATDITLYVTRAGRPLMLHYTIN